MGRRVKTWAIEIRRAKEKTVWAFPYNLPTGSMPPYPGFEVLEQWLEIFGPDCQYQRLYNEGNPVLEITFNKPEECFMFILTAGQPKL